MSEQKEWHCELVNVEDSTIEYFGSFTLEDRDDLNDIAAKFVHEYVEMEIYKATSLLHMNAEAIIRGRKSVSEIIGTTKLLEPYLDIEGNCMATDRGMAERRTDSDGFINNDGQTVLTTGYYLTETYAVSFSHCYETEENNGVH